MSSINKLRKTLSEGAEILSVTRKEYSFPLTTRKLSELVEVVRSFVLAENYFLNHFSGILGLCHVSYPRKLRDHFVKEGLPKELSKLGLQDRQWKMALDISFDNIKASHATTQKETKAALVRSPSLNDSEKHLVRYILQRPILLSHVCIGRFKEVQAILGYDSQSSKFNQVLKKALNEAKNPKICLQKTFMWLRRHYRKAHAKHQRPTIRKFRTYHLDSSMFKFFKEGQTCYISVASKTPNKRIVIPLTNSSLTANDFSGNIKVVLRKDSRVEIHRTINQMIPKIKITKEEVVREQNQSKLVAMDKGLRTLIHTDGGHTYGEGYSKKFMGWSDELTEINAGRGRFHSIIRILEQKSERADSPKAKEKLQKKILRIKENNLGSEKVTRKREFIRLEVKKEIGTAVNLLFKTEQPEVLITENLKFISFKNLGKRTNRLLNSWSKGTLRDALELGAKRNGVLLEEVNAAYSSQQCSVCFYVHRKNRQGDLFDCTFCGYKENADFVAARNLRDRFFDSEISVKTPVKEVKEILLKQHRVRLSTLDLSKLDSRLPSANNQKMGRAHCPTF